MKKILPTALLSMALAAILAFSVSQIRHHNMTSLTAPESSDLLTGSSPPPRSEPKQAAEIIEGVYGAGITFYGKTVDQSGDPVPDANVRYSVLDQFFQPGTKYTGTTAKDGTFSITGIRGAAMSVIVFKEGYEGIYKSSNGNFSFGVPFDPERDRPTPTKNNPAVFVLRKKSPIDPLLHTSHRQRNINNQGDPTEIDLSTGEAVPVGHGDLRVECWTGDTSHQFYNWRCRISVPNGGLIPRDPEREFEAPEGGYVLEENIEISSTDENWSRKAEREYFLKLANNRYARAKVTVYTSAKRTFFVLESYLNPSGSRNLEAPSNPVPPF